jgi:class 3 adenylate cyclase
LTTPGRKDELVIRNDTKRPLFFVVEDRNWTLDALTGERVIAMPAFRRLCPEQLLRPGDDVAIGRVAIVFTDLQGSTKLYEDLGDATAYRLVRDHFAFLSERVQHYHGFIVKTVGDAVMAAFHDPADAVRAVLSIQDDVAKFNRGRREAGIVLKLGLHAGSCIAVTSGDVLDYFGSAVNTAARLEHQCRGGEVVVSEAVLADTLAREALAGRSMTADSAMMRGLSEPVRFFRVAAAERADELETAAEARSCPERPTAGDIRSNAGAARWRKSKKCQADRTSRRVSQSRISSTASFWAMSAMKRCCWCDTVTKSSPSARIARIIMDRSPTAS